MKVTVCFDGVRIVVPCDDGRLTVHDLAQRALPRYLKALNLPSKSSIHIRSLRSEREDGPILDPDDEVAAVLDDREQIVAIFDQPTILSDGSDRPSCSRSASVDDDSMTALGPVCHSASGSVLSRSGGTDGNSTQGSARLRSSGGGGRFARTAARQSRVTDRMMEAAEKLRDGECGDSGISISETVFITLEPDASSSQSLGVGLQPSYDNNGRIEGLRIEQIGSEGRLTDPRLRAGDVILEVNGERLGDVEFQSAHSLLQSHLHSTTTLVLRRPVRTRSPSSDRTYSSATLPNRRSRAKMEDEGVGLSRGTFRRASLGATQAAHEASVDRLATPFNGSSPGLQQHSALQKGNTRRIGQTYRIELEKDPAGLGFSLTTRDITTTDDDIPIYIKNILPRGSAVLDGRLKPGDRLLSVDGISVSGKTQQEVVAILRSIPTGAMVEIGVSRPESGGATPQNSASPELKPRREQQQHEEQQPLRDATTTDSSNTQQQQQLQQNAQRMHTYDIRLNDTGSAGLGLSVKGRTTTAGEDMGIFIKGILHGGAVHKDGRLQVNDRLVSIAATRLLNAPNDRAISLVRSAMTSIDGDTKVVRITVLRSPLLDVSTDSTSSTSSAHPTPHYTVPGYGEYALVVKSPTINMPRDGDRPLLLEDSAWQRRRDGTTVVAIGAEKKQPPPQPDVALNDAASSVCESEAGDGFVREAAGRRSMSEKRRGAAQMDPTHTQLYQKIRHARQASAPLLDMSSSTPTKQLDDTIKTTPDRNNNETTTSPVADDVAFRKDTNLANASAARHAHLLVSQSRRSMSLESLPQTGPIVHHIPVAVEQRGPGKALIDRLRQRNTDNTGSVADRNRPTNDSFRSAVDRSYEEYQLENETYERIQPTSTTKKGRETVSTESGKQRSNFVRQLLKGFGGSGKRDEPPEVTAKPIPISPESLRARRGREPSYEQLLHNARQRDVTPNSQEWRVPQPPPKATQKATPSSPRLGVSSKTHQAPSTPGERVRIVPGDMTRTGIPSAGYPAQYSSAQLLQSPSRSRAAERASFGRGQQMTNGHSQQQRRMQNSQSAFIVAGGRAHVPDWDDDSTYAALVRHQSLERRFNNRALPTTNAVPGSPQRPPGTNNKAPRPWPPERPSRHTTAGGPVPHPTAAFPHSRPTALPLAEQPVPRAPFPCTAGVRTAPHHWPRTPGQHQQSPSPTTAILPMRRTDDVRRQGIDDDNDQEEAVPERKSSWTDYLRKGGSKGRRGGRSNRPISEFVLPIRAARAPGPILPPFGSPPRPMLDRYRNSTFHDDHSIRFVGNSAFHDADLAARYLTSYDVVAPPLPPKDRQYMNGNVGTPPPIYHAPGESWDRTKR